MNAREPDGSEIEADAEDKRLRRLEEKAEQDLQALDALARSLEASNERFRHESRATQAELRRRLERL